MDLCGHGTLASVFAVFEYLNPQAGRVDFQTKSGLLSVERQGALLTMDFPSRRPEPCPPPDHLAEILGIPPLQTLRARDLVVVYEEEEQIRCMLSSFPSGAENCSVLTWGIGSPLEAKRQLTYRERSG